MHRVDFLGGPIMRILTVLLATVVTGAYASAAPAQSATAEAEVRLGKVANQYICKFDGSVRPGNVRAEAGRAVNPELGQVLHVYEHVLRGFAVRLPATLGGPASDIARIKKNNAKIAACEQDQYGRAFVQGKPGGGGGSGQTTPWGITRVRGVSNYTGTGRAWIIDTGIDLDHPDLNVDRASSVDIVQGSTGDDGNGHGTHVAGTVAAMNNTVGVIGVAPGATVIAVRVLNNAGRGTYSDIIKGVEHVGANGRSGDVANMSLGGGVSALLDQAVLDASAVVKFTLAAGNSSANAMNYSPARAGATMGDNVYTVSSFAQGDRWSSFSNYGDPPIEYAEPGSGILSTYKGGGYKTLSGTSMAAPHLAGVILLGSIGTCGAVTGDPSAPADSIGCH